MIPIHTLKTFAFSILGFLITCLGFLIAKYTNSVYNMDICALGLSIMFLPLLLILLDLSEKVHQPQHEENPV